MKKFIFPALMMAVLAFSACGNGGEKKQDDGNVPVADTSKGEMAYICPCGGCPEIRESAPGKCSKCDMDLVEEKK